MSANQGSSGGVRPPRELTLHTRSEHTQVAEIKNGNKVVGKKEIRDEEYIYRDADGNRYIYKHHHEEEIFAPARNAPSGGQAQQGKGKGKQASSDTK
jgi:hypothetical protein